MHKKILLCGFYGAQNLGDELMLDTIVKKIKELEKKVNITVLISDTSLVKNKQYKGMNYIDMPKSITEYDDICKKYDCLIFGGGALIDDEKYSSDKVGLENILIELSSKFILNNKNVICLGLSSNKELRNKEFIKKLNFVIEKSKYFSLRDTNSYNSLVSCGINSVDKIKICNDIVLSNLELIHKNNIIMKKEKNNVLNIGVILIFNGLKITVLEEIIKKIVKIIEKKYVNYRMNLIPFYNYKNFDINQYKILKKRLLNDNIYLFNYSDDLNDIISLINSQDYIFSMRYHGSLLATFLNKKIVSITCNTHSHYVNKMTYLKKYNNNILNYNLKEFINSVNLYDEVFDIKRSNLIDKMKMRKIIKNTNKELLRVLDKNI